MSIDLKGRVAIVTAGEAVVPPTTRHRGCTRLVVRLRI